MPDHESALLAVSGSGTEWPAGLVDLYATHWAPMVRLARLLTASDAASEEIVQDAFLRVRARWDAIDTPPAYLRATVVNGCRNHQRRRLLERRQPASAEVMDDKPDELRGAIAALPARPSLPVWRARGRSWWKFRRWLRPQRSAPRAAPWSAPTPTGLPC